MSYKYTWRGDEQRRCPHRPPDRRLNDNDGVDRPADVSMSSFARALVCRTFAPSDFGKQVTGKFPSSSRSPGAGGGEIARKVRWAARCLSEPASLLPGRSIEVRQSRPISRRSCATSATRRKGRSWSGVVTQKGQHMPRVADKYHGRPVRRTGKRYRSGRCPPYTG